jgi:hypothetical protein
VLVAAVLWWLLRTPQSDPSPQVVAEPGTPTSPAATAAPADSPPKTEAELRQKAVAMIEGVFNTPIEFYGRVVDQSGGPVPDAHVGIGVNDRFNASGSNYSTTSDKDGYFSFKGARGASMGVNVRKEGYYQIHKVSNQSFAYGMGPDGAHQAPPTKDNPAIFVLHKMGETEPLLFVSGRQFDVPATGQPTSIDLATGRTNNGALQVASWLGEATQQRFDWRYQLRIPGGGLIERKGQFDFEAPENGYEESIGIDMPAAAEEWSSRLEKNYFAKLPDGRYARFTVRFYPGTQRNFVVLESHMNPTPGSRNLEYDPKQTAGAP